MNIKDKGAVWILIIAGLLMGSGAGVALAGGGNGGAGCEGRLLYHFSVNVAQGGTAQADFISQYGKNFGPTAIPPGFNLVVREVIGTPHKPGTGANPITFFAGSEAVASVVFPNEASTELHVPFVVQGGATFGAASSTAAASEMTVDIFGDLESTQAVPTPFSGAGIN